MMWSQSTVGRLATTACLLAGVDLTQGKSLTSLLAGVATEHGIHSTSAWRLNSPGSHHGVEHAISRAPVAASTEVNITLADSLAQVQGILANIEKEPTCKRLAAKNLVHACSTYDGRGSTAATDEVLELHQKHFAIRMTECELGDAKQSMPKSCGPLLASPATKEPQRYVNQCLSDLYDQGSNSWTSFNAVKSNAHIMCSAMRSQHDKDEQIKFLELLLEANKNLNHAMDYHGEQANTMRQQFHEITVNVKEFHSQMHEDNEVLKQAVKESWDKLQQNMTTMGSDLEGLLQTVINTAKHVNEHAEETELALARFETMRANSDSWNEDFARWRTEAEVAQAQRKYQMQQELDMLSTAVGQVTRSVETANGLTSTLAAEIDSIDFRLNSVMTNVQSLDEGSDVLVNKQRDTLERMDDLQSKSEAALESVEATLEKMGTLKTIVESITAILGNITAVIPSFGFLAEWYMLLFLSGVFVFLWLCGLPKWGAGVMSLISIWGKSSRGL